MPAMVKGEDENTAMEESIEKEWRAAQLFMAKGPSATVQYLMEDIRAQLSAYRAQGLDGPCPPAHDDGFLVVDPVLKRKQDAWKSLGEMPKHEAKKMFVKLLTAVVPDWKDWDDVHGEAFRAAQLEGGEAERLLRAFKNRTGLQLPSRL